MALRVTALGRSGCRCWNSSTGDTRIGRRPRDDGMSAQDGSALFELMPAKALRRLIRPMVRSGARYREIGC